MDQVNKVEWSALGGDFVTVLAHALLMRAGGQQSFTDEDLKSVVSTYVGIRMWWDEEKKTLTLTLRTKELDEEKKI